MTSFTTTAQITYVQVTVLKNAIKLFLKTGMKANRAYTPKNMLATAGRLTGKTYKRGQLEQAMLDLDKVQLDMLAEAAKNA